MTVEKRVTIQWLYLQLLYTMIKLNAQQYQEVVEIVEGSNLPQDFVSRLLKVSEDIRGTPNKSTEYHTITRNEVV